MLKNASVEAAIIAQAIKSGRALPDAIANAPELRDGLELYWFAFWDLVSCRYDALQPIPWRDVQYWADVHRLDRVQARNLNFVVREMDGAFLSYAREKAKADTEKRNGPNRR